MKKCIYHEVEFHDITECYAFKKLSGPEKFKVLEEKGICDNIIMIV